MNNRELYRKRVFGKGIKRDLLPTSFKLFSVNKKSSFMQSVFKFIEKNQNKNSLYEHDYPIANHRYVPIAGQVNKNMRVLALQNYNEHEGHPFEELSYTKWIDSDEVKIISNFLKSKFKTIWRCRINVIPQFGGLPWHIDTNTSVACRVYLPLTSNIDQDNLFEIERRGCINSLKMKVGEFWFVNTGFKHRVLNKTNKMRYSLIFSTVSEEN